MFIDDNRRGKIDQLAIVRVGLRVKPMEIFQLITLLIENEELLELAWSTLPESERGELFDTVAIKLLDRFEWNRSTDDLDRAITIEERVLTLTQDDHPNRGMRLHNLGAALHRRFEVTGSMEDLDHAIAIKGQAVESTSDGHPDRAAMLNSLGISLQSRFDRTGSTEDLDRTIVMKEQAVESTPQGHPARAGRLVNLGNALWRRFERTGSMEDLDHAIRKKKQAVESTPDGHPARAWAVPCRFAAAGLGVGRTREVEGGEDREPAELDLAEWKALGEQLPVVVVGGRGGRHRAWRRRWCAGPNDAECLQVEARGHDIDCDGRGERDRALEAAGHRRRHRHAAALAGCGQRECLFQVSRGCFCVRGSITGTSACSQPVSTTSVTPPTAVATSQSLPCWEIERMFRMKAWPQAALLQYRV